jgi:uncharacterized membrane protein
MKTFNKLALAAAAATLFSGAIAPIAHAEEAAGVKCEGINSCKGTSKCATATTSCAGHNACKGQGWIMVASAEECTKQGGTVKE